MNLVYQGMRKESSLTTTKKHKNLEITKDGCQDHQRAMKLNQNRPVEKKKRNLSTS